MDMKKLPFSEPYLFQRRKIASEFGLGVGISLVLLVKLFLNNSLKIPTRKPFLQGFEWPLSLTSPADFSYSSRSNSSTNATSKSQNYVDFMQWRERERVGDARERLTMVGRGRGFYEEEGSGRSWGCEKKM